MSGFKRRTISKFLMRFNKRGVKQKINHDWAGREKRDRGKTGFSIGWPNVIDGSELTTSYNNQAHNDGNRNSNNNINILDNFLWPVITRHFLNRPSTFQDDNAPCHVSRQANQWKTENDFNTFELPPQNPGPSFTVIP